jgi:uncharacterized repeat protein (TIGR03803 family)
MLKLTNRGTAPARSRRPLDLEWLESRLLLSSYGLSQIGYFSSNATGATPKSTLIADSAGNLYGTTSAGGTTGLGAAFEIAAGSGTLTALASLNGADGKNPLGALTLDAAGNLYGAASAGGVNNDGTIFEIAAGSNAVTALASFNGTNGIDPQGGLALDSAGDLYGTTDNRVVHRPQWERSVRWRCDAVRRQSLRNDKYWRGE